MAQRQGLASEPTAAPGRPAPRAAQVQAQAQAQSQAQADPPFGSMLAIGLVAGAVASVIEERLAEAAPRQAAPIVSPELPAKDATSAGHHSLATGGPIALDPGHDAGTASDAVLSPSHLSPSHGSDHTDTASLANHPAMPMTAAEPAAAATRFVSTELVEPIAQPATVGLSGQSEGSTSFDLTGRIAHEMTGAIGQIAVQLGRFAESGGMLRLDHFGEALAQEIAGAATRIATDLTSTFNEPLSGMPPLAAVASVPTHMLAEISSTVDHVIAAVDVPPSLLGAEVDHVTTPLLSRLFDYAEPAQAPVPHAPELTTAGDGGAFAVSHLAGDIGAISIGFAGQSYVDTHSLQDGALGPATHLLHGFI